MKRLFHVIFISFCIFPSFVYANVYTNQEITKPSSVSNSTEIVKLIDIKGNKTINVSSILSKIKTRAGQPYLDTVISDDLKRLYNTGYFSDVRVKKIPYMGGVKVVIYVKEKPIVDEITFSKTRYIKIKAIKEKLKTVVGKFLDKRLLKEDINTIKQMYVNKGFTNAEVDVQSFVDDVTNKASVHFMIKEGNRVVVRRIYISGNYHYPDKRILKIIKTRSKTLFNSGKFKQEVLDEDMERIMAFYEQNGFIDANADYTIKKMKKGGLEIDIHIDEGKQYFIDSVVVVGNKEVTDKEILSVIKNVKQGEIFSKERVEEDINNIRALYFDRGYIFANVEDSTSLDEYTGKVKVKIKINEGEVAYIRKIKIQGNTRTRDIVIRRELRMFPGDRFDGGKLRRSKERLNNLGYFEEVGFDIEDTSIPNEKDLVVQVKEAKTGTFSFGGGFSTVDKFVGFIEIEQRNFDITNWPTFTGGGQHLQLRAETGSTRNNLILSFFEPWLFDYPVSFGFNAFRTERTKEEDIGYAYDEERVGGDISLGKQFSEYVSGTVSYKREVITIDNMDSNVSADLAAEKGTNTVSMISFDLKRDSRDNVFSPTKGFIISGSFDIAGKFFGGDKEFYRTQFIGSYYIPLKFDSVLEFRLRAGVIDAYGDSSKVPIFERFFAGGARTIRGYDERKVGPLDSVTNDPIGGEGMLVANIEYTIPIIDIVKMAAFFDSGNVWADMNDFGSGGIKSGVGIGLRVKTPVGPINLDYGYPLNKEPGEDSRSGKFYFSISRGF